MFVFARFLRHCAVMSLPLLALTACGGAESSAPPEQPVGLANPAAVYCETLGGQTSIKTTAAGQAGLCTLPDGTRIDEWALFRRDFPENAEIDKP